MTTTRKTAYIGLLTALAIVLALLEQFVPIGAVIPLPGIKLGIANVVTLLVLYLWNQKCAWTVALLRCTIVALLFGTPISFAMSVSGAVLSLIIMSFLIKYPKYFSWYGISIAGAAMHNIGQVICACFWMKNTALFAYLPFLLLASVLTGALIAVIFKMLIRISKPHF